MKILKELFFLFKVHHWVKNLVIFLPIFVSNSMFLFELSEYFFHFFNFSIITSIIYFLNNVYDYEQDLLNKELKYKISKNKYKYFFFWNYFFNYTFSFIIFLWLQIIHNNFCLFHLSDVLQHYFKKNKIPRCNSISVISST